MTSARGTTRRDILLVGASSVFASLLGCGGSVHQGQSDLFPDDDAASFLQMVLFLQAEALSYGLAGSGIDIANPSLVAGRGHIGPSTGGKMVPDFVSTAPPAVLTALRTDALAQLTVVRGLAGSESVVGKPPINLIAVSANSFDALANYLDLIRQLTDFAASALLGALPGLQSSSRAAVVAELASVQLAYGALIRALLNAGSLPSTAIDGSDPDLTHFGAFLSGVAVVRNRAAALAYLVGSTSSGRFFPSGLNTPNTLP
jgi:hypothetical protein